MRVTLVSSLHRRLLFSNSNVILLEKFLSSSINDEVIIINSNFGMEIYYYSSIDYFDFIVETVKFYGIKKIAIEKLKFENNNEECRVYQSFCNSLVTFSQYPQIFLAYTKKFVSIKLEHAYSKAIIPILDSYFAEVLNHLETKGTLPHLDKVLKIRNKKSQESAYYNVIKELILEILSNDHRN
ncbi:hypothetical protein ACE939_11520 [Aquimarina sp. W85]|uniref:hypothetical protein n=1 Tax=Aquimarina rhodophyticola TaxID=3342246 RepID=UPI00366DA446